MPSEHLPPCFDLYDPKLRAGRGCSLCPHYQSCRRLTALYSRRQALYYWADWAITFGILAALAAALYYTL